MRNNWYFFYIILEKLVKMILFKPCLVCRDVESLMLIHLRAQAIRFKLSMDGQVFDLHE